MVNPPGKDGNFCGKFPAQDWLYVTLQNLTETRTVQYRTYHWRTKVLEQHSLLMVIKQPFLKMSYHNFQSYSPNRAYRAF
jgi:hypothetical protein